MKQTIDLTERISGKYWQAVAILRLQLPKVVRAPLEELRFETGGGALTRRVEAVVGVLASGPSRSRVPLRWRAAERPHLFPMMDGELQITDVHAREIELRLVGEYTLPLGALGRLGNALAGHRVVERTLRGLLKEIARRLREELVERVESKSWKPPRLPQVRERST